MSSSSTEITVNSTIDDIAEFLSSRANHLLIQYEGGGYDGCIWEWNFAVYIDGEYTSIMHSGADGCPTLKDLWNWLTTKSISGTLYEENYDYFLYNLDSQEDMREFAEHNVAEVVVLMDDWLCGNSYAGLDAPCRFCGEFFPVPEMGYTDEAYSGIVSWHCNFVCPDCLEERRCESCNYIAEDPDELCYTEGLYQCLPCHDKSSRPTIPIVPAILEEALEIGNYQQIRALKRLEHEIDEYIEDAKFFNSIRKDPCTDPIKIPENEDWGDYLRKDEVYS